jgi:DNA-binding GntR family transcriptional regulator
MLAAARSRWLLRFDAQLVVHFERYRRMRLRELDSVRALAELSAKEHEELMNAALSRDVGAACSLLKGHLARATIVSSERFTK